MEFSIFLKNSVKINENLNFNGNNYNCKEFTLDYPNCLEARILNNAFEYVGIFCGFINSLEFNY